VLALLINIPTEIAGTRGGIGMRACPPAVAGGFAPSGVTAIFARPRAAWAPASSGLAQLTGQEKAIAQPAYRKQYAHTTRVAVLSGGTTGSHPPREPEPA
jgi:hypothetical protein